MRYSYVLIVLALLIVGCNDKKSSKKETKGADAGTDTPTDSSVPPTDSTVNSTSTDTATTTVKLSCAGVICNHPPDNTCENDVILSVFNETGLCESGSCVYAPVFEQCIEGICQSGICSGTPCQGMQCRTPPANMCVDDKTLNVHNPVGYCGVNDTLPTCMYANRLVTCATHCRDGRCIDENPCARKVCDSPPARYCDESGELIVWDALPKCEDGECIYGMQSVACASGCSTGSCLGEDVCEVIRCKTPPANYCVNAATLKTFDAKGTCESSICEYASQDISCTSGCVEGRCVDDPCTGVACDDPPAAHCVDITTLVRWDGAPGICSDGICSYNLAKISCYAGCAEGRCVNEPCFGILCNNPPPPHCAATGNRIVYQTAGSCIQTGICTYEKTEETCANGCSKGRCISSLTGGDTDSVTIDSDTEPSTVVPIEDTATNETDLNTDLNDTASTDSDTDGDTVTTDSADPNNADFHVQFDLSPIISTVGIVTWSIDKVIESAAIAFGPQNGSYEYTAPVDLSTENYRTLLLGMKPDSTYKFVITAVGNGKTYVSDEYKITAGAKRSGLPIISIEESANVNSLYEGFTIACVFGIGITSTSWTFVLDRDGDHVWWHQSSGEPDCVRAKMSYDGKYMYSANSNVPGKTNGTLTRVTMDGLEEDSFPVQSRHHDIAVVPPIDDKPEQVAFIDYNSADECDSIRLLNPETEEIETLVDLRSILSVDDCHVNAINYERSSHSFTVADLNSNAVIHLDSEGTVLWIVGGDDATLTGMSFTAVHQHQILDTGNLLIFTNRGGFPEADEVGSYVLEMALNLEEQTTSYVWHYYGHDSTQSLGDAKRLPNGNTLVTYSNSGTIHEVGPSGTLIRRILTDSIGYIVRRQSLYGPPPDYLY